MRQSHELKYLGEIIRTDYANKLDTNSLIQVMRLRGEICFLLAQPYLNASTLQRLNTSITTLITTIHASYRYPKTTQALSYCFQKLGLPEPILLPKHTRKADGSSDQAVMPGTSNIL